MQSITLLRSHLRSQNQNRLPRPHFKFEKGSRQPTHSLTFRSVLTNNYSFTLNLPLVNHLGNKIMVVLLLQVVQRLVCCCLFLQLLYLHLVVEQLVRLRVAVLQD